MVDANIAYIKTEPITPAIQCSYVKTPNYRCTIELIDGSTITRCGFTEQHALANALACYRTSGRPKANPETVIAGNTGNVEMWETTN